MRDERQRSGFVGPLILVGIGILFLLSNLGIFQVNVWRLASTLWPVILIGIGLDILIGRRSATGSLLALLLTALFLIGGALYVGGSPSAPVRGEVTEIRYAPGPVGEADVHIAGNTGRLEVGSMAEGGVLVLGTVRLGGSETIQEESKEENGKAIYRLSSEGVGVVGVSGSESVWNLRLNGEIPTQLAVNTGAGEAELDLQRLRLTGLQVELGVGAATISLPRAGLFDGNISGGIGRLVIRVPDSLAVELQVDTGIGQVSVDNGFVLVGDNRYRTAAAQREGEKAALKISSGIGQVVIETISGE